MSTLRALSFRIAAGLLFTLFLSHRAAAAPFAYIANSNSDTVSIIDVATKIVVATVTVGRGPFGVAANVGGPRVYVLNALDNTVSVIDAATRTVIGTVVVGYADGNAADLTAGDLTEKVAGLAIDPEGRRVYVANPQNNTVAVIDTSTNTVIGPTIAVGARPLGVAVSPSGSYVYVTNSGSNTLSIVDATTNLAIAEVPVGSAPRGVAVHPSGSFAYVATADGLAIVDPSAKALVATVTLGAHGVATSADGRNVYVTTDDGGLVVIDALTNLRVGGPIDLAHASGVSVTPDGRFVYVTNSASDTVSVIDAATHTLVYAVNVGSGPAALGTFIGDVAPVATAQSVSTPPNTTAAIVLTATDADNDPLTFRVVAEPVHGMLTGTPPALTYTPAADYAGLDTFTFTANDGALDSDVATVSIAVPFRTETSLTSDVDPSSFGQAITLTATVTSVGGTPMGTVRFFDGAVLLGSSTLNGAKASLTTVVNAGIRSITAVYERNGMFVGSASPALVQTVNKATGTASLTVSALTPQYSDVETFRATFTPSVPSGLAPTKVSFKVGRQPVGEATPTPVIGGYQYTWTGQLLDPEGTATRQMKPDFRVVTATFVDANFSVTNPIRAITIQKEDARVAYGGPTSFSLGGRATGTVVLTVTVKDISAVSGDSRSDSYPGDIRNATVSFVDRSTNMILGTVNPTPSESDPRIGTATFKWSMDLGTAKSKTYTIGFIVSYYYNRNSTGDNAIVTITKQ